ncbi:fad linked oxidase-like protein [Apiospora kogelbergensis]|uniref:Fad linked oxidase-like protein n=1 Tax=Apiospora kogelbergensis TaxID=1337665 RepID=A0AAW0QBX5_9PEZI
MQISILLGTAFISTAFGVTIPRPNAATTARGNGYPRETRGADGPATACSEAQAELGDSIVQTTPLNQTIVENNWSPFAIRSGGHSPNPGWSSIGSTGVLLDMSAMNAVNLSADAGTISIGPGARWGQVAAAADAKNVAVVGAREPETGVGGVVLGGGYFYQTSEYGLAADNVKSFEVVLADGTTIEANADENSDLFWSLKGGGPNFGIVTRFDMHTIPSTDLWYTAYMYSPDKAPELLDSMAQWQQEGAADLRSSAIFSIGLDSVLVLLTYGAHTTATPAAFEPFYRVAPLVTAIPPTNGTVRSLYDLTSSGFAPTVGRHDYRGVSSQIDAQLYRDVYGFWLERATAVREAVGANQTFVIQHVSDNVAQQGIKNGGNPLGLPQKSHQWWTTLVDWNDAKDDEMARSASIATTARWKEVSRERGLDVDFLYMNDASRDQNPLAGYGEKNIARLKEVALKYDPSQVFQNLQNGGFLLSRL